MAENEKQIQQLLIVSFGPSDSPAALLRIAATSDRNLKNIENQPKTDQIPEYIRIHECKSMCLIGNKTDIDDFSPIQIYCGEEPDLSPILLLEETEYDLELSGCIESAFDYFNSNTLKGENNVVLKLNNFSGNNGSAIYKLLFKGYVGKGKFDVTTKDGHYEVHFEVRSKKMSYLEDYPKMLEDITEFSTSLLLKVDSPLYNDYSIYDEASADPYETFLVLDYLFSKLNIISAYRHIRMNCLSEMVQTNERMPLDRCSFIDPGDISWIVESGNVVPMANGPILDSFAPLEVMEREYEECYDIPENRFVKDLILSVQHIVNRLMRPGILVSSYAEKRLKSMAFEIDLIAREPWLKDIGQLHEIPYWSLKLQRLEGYRELFIAHHMLSMSLMFRNKDIENLIAGQNKQITLVYEYWCYTKLYSILNECSDNKVKFPFVKDKNKWTVSIKRSGVRFKITRYGAPLHVTLYYNKKFNNELELASYSIGLTPDFTLVIKTSNKGPRFLIHFDAKYKVKPKKESEIQQDDRNIVIDCWEYDIYKMHTYRDALMHSWGSYILYPGTKKITYHKPLGDPQWATRDKILIPSVGAIPLNPQKYNTTDGNELSKLISDILYKLSNLFLDFENGEINLDEPYRIQEIMSMPPLHSVKDKIKD